tara:strand:+ start:692 stop:1654 length:963 start_codon:yes stop_codon:yes gene_type:complete
MRTKKEQKKMTKIVISKTDKAHFNTLRTGLADAIEFNKTNAKDAVAVLRDYVRPVIKDVNGKEIPAGAFDVETKAYEALKKSFQKKGFKKIPYSVMRDKGLSVSEDDPDYRETKGYTRALELNSQDIGCLHRFLSSKPDMRIAPYIHALANRYDVHLSAVKKAEAEARAKAEAEAIEKAIENGTETEAEAEAENTQPDNSPNENEALSGVDATELQKASESPATKAFKIGAIEKAQQIFAGLSDNYDVGELKTILSELQKMAEPIFTAEAEAIEAERKAKAQAEAKKAKAKKSQPRKYTVKSETPEQIAEADLKNRGIAV